MSFVSIPFFILLAATLLSQVILRNPRPRQLALLVASYVFYGWWDWRFCFLMMGLTVVVFFSALATERSAHRKACTAVGVIAPLAVLFFFKYFNFFVDSFCAVFGIPDAGALAIILPVGISFYTFQSLSYTIDAYRGKVPVCHDFWKFALYIAFFPQLVAGPIVKASEFLYQLDENRGPTLVRLGSGLTVFFWGMFKKAVLADQLSLFVDSVFAAPAAYGSATLVLAVVSYAMQIYFDFSGYSDMAIGCARCLGYDLPRNFDLPYISRNVSEFWKRWHISLSSWLQQYLYFSLGGNRKGRARTYVNLMVTMLLGGLWHGANWTFVIWGGLHGVALCVHKAWARRFPSRGGRVGRVLATVLTFAFVCFCWVFFRADSLDAALAIVVRIFSFSTGVEQLYAWSVVAALFMIITIAWCAKRNRAEDGRVHALLPTLDLGTFVGWLAFFLLIGFTFILMYTGESPFIYFQF